MPDPLSLSPDQLPIVQELQRRRSTLTPEQQTMVDELQRRSQQQAQPSPDDSNYPNLTRFLDQGSTDFGAMLNNFGQQATVGGNVISDLFHNPMQLITGQGQTAQQTLPDLARGLYQQSKGQVQRSLGMGQVPDPLTAIPGVGEDILNMQQRLRDKDYGGATADLLGLSGQALGPELLKGAQAPERALGRSLYRQSFNFPEDLSLADREKVRSLGLNLNLPTTGQRSIDYLGRVDKPDTFLGQMEKGVQDNIGQVRTQPVDMMKVFRPLLDEIQSIDPRAGGGAQVRSAMLQDLQEKMKQFGWTPKNPSFSKPITVEEAQKIKRDTYNLLSEKYYGDTQQTSQIPGSKRANMLYAQGLKDAIEDKAPGVKQYNDQMHNAINLQNTLIDMEKRNPGVLRQWGKYIIGGAGMLGGATFAEASGHPIMGGAAMAATIAAAVAKDPAAASRFGLVMSHMGTGMPTRVAGYSPLAGRISIPPNLNQENQ